MRFGTATLEHSVDSLLAIWQNIRWEDRVSDVRRIGYESALARSGAEGLEMAHGRYVNNQLYVKDDDEEPACFDAANAPALLTVAPDEELVRVVDLTACAETLARTTGGSPLATDAIKAAYDADDDRFERFIDDWNDFVADKRPMFAALRRDLNQDRPGWKTSWGTALPELLGLGHVEAGPGNPRALALLEYRAERVFREPGAVPPQHRFAAPTVIDLLFNPYFCPSPTPHSGVGVHAGRAMNLSGQGTLVGEVIHRHVPLASDMITEVVVLTGKGNWITLPEMRKAHVDALRRCPEWTAFGS